MRPWLLVIAACGGMAEAPAPVARQEEADGVRGNRGPAAAKPAESAAEPEALEGMLGGMAGIGGKLAKDEAPAAPPPPPPPGAKGGDDDAGGESARVRAWFPEAFLWQPLLETDAEGRGQVALTVPDQLTTWRVLALAHDRSGRQSGATHTFDSRLALYADPVVPAWLHVGDTLALPVQLVNSSDAAVAGSLSVSADGALRGGGSGAVRLEAGGSNLVAFAVDATEPGIGTVRAVLSGPDAGDTVVREIRVVPRGKPVDVERGGRLAGTRTFALDGPDDGASRELEVQVYGGALGLLQAELERLAASGVADGGYAFALASRAGGLAARSNASLDPKVLRRLELLGWQKVVREARNPSAAAAADLLVGLGPVEGRELVDELRPRLIAAIASGQRGDGTWSRRSEATLQEVLAQTAWVARALPLSAEAPRRRAAGALERFAPEIRDPYTASLALSTGLVAGDRAEILRKIVTDALVSAPDGARTIAVPPDVRNPWGIRPSRAEVLTFAALALADGDDRSDLVGQVMGGWRGEWGFGAGRADAVALELVAGSLPGVAEPVDVGLWVDGVEIGHARIDPSQPLVPGLLLARGIAADPSVEIRATPATAGLAWSARLRSYVAWSADDRLPGVDVEVTVPSLAVGRPGDVRIEVAAPAGVPIALEQGLAPGITVDPTTWSLPFGATAEVGTDRVRLNLPARGPGETSLIVLPVEAAFAGTFTTVPLVVGADGREVVVEPATWRVAAR